MLSTALYGCIERWRQRLVIVCFIINFVCDVRKHISFCETRKRLVSPSCSFVLSLVAAMQVVHACVVLIVYMCVNHSFRESHFVCVSTCMYVYANSAPFQQWSLSYKQGLKRARPACLSCVATGRCTSFCQENTHTCDGINKGFREYRLLRHTIRCWNKQDIRVGFSFVRDDCT